MYASHTRTWEEDSDGEEDDYLIASQINASINASVKSFRFQINRFFDYTSDVILEQDADWNAICRCVIKDMQLVDDLAVTRGDGVYEHKKPVVEFR